MPREIFELTPPQLEWLIENQSLSLTSGEALHESSKMSSGWGGSGLDAAQSFGGYPSGDNNNTIATSSREFPPFSGPHHDNYPPTYSEFGPEHEDPHHHRHHHHKLAAASGSSSDSHEIHLGSDRAPLQDEGEYFKDKYNVLGDGEDPYRQHHHQYYDHHHDNENNSSLNNDIKASKKKSKTTSSEPDPYKHRIGKLTWEQSFENLKVYADMNGHCNVPRYFNDHPQLGSWVHRQRLKRKSPKKYGFLSPDQVNQLTELGFCWQLRGEGKEQYLPQAAQGGASSSSAKVSPRKSNGD
mmetsp:Transcript_16131/g.35433  ORF Transcript_16131/g.35433 Transcript_16131/m.35433 type:complete len:297 (+) Transcript_16131:139-1029(+)|eukprot:CAMPEP_0168733526 /NCGR_PEP_ID=MMETSP0724-20121128/8340_1 /TAXON_ID=265536 /ORGANISM="Amphiprora sp., Strain CCMP467" /LENGTH=296 /DNA_ID=CAMNT_0008780595 /DNA_START=161 /DNA_END=1051 /DNA_ORIENTATION=+